jgi:hypothetical protein
MSHYTNEKHTNPLPSLRHIRRACQRELYRTVKRLNTHITPDLIIEAEKLYLRKVVLNLVWIHENGSRRKLLADWWCEQVCPEIAVLWNIEPQVLAKAFRDAFE